MGMLVLQQQQWRWRWEGASSHFSSSRYFSSPRLPSFAVPHLRLHRTAPRCLLQADESISCTGVSRICEPHRLPFLGLLPPFTEGRSSRANPWSVNLKALQRAVLLLMGLAAFFSLELPAVADLGIQGTVAAALQEAKFSEIMTSAWAGLMAGCLHTLTGPDHLAALAPLCIGRAKVESALVGALWGCGHDAGQIIFGLFFLLLKGKLKIELLQVWASRVVGITLLAIGAVGLKEAQEVPVSVLAAEGPRPSEVVEDRKTTHRLRTFATGIVYGLQPDALIVILPALALPSRLAGAAYLGMFLLGTVVAMGSYTAFIGSCGQALQSRVPWITRRLTIGSSIVAIIFGLGVLLGELFGINFFH
ncbi:hypothetical protein GOP47_0011166 [Adiantum capillus-veneris]|uniref:Urease accessory protein UreH-like transmembrane domain-containing protein n=1 Tax=Adiantum capillus-veneris TaxID=13818 RepID=A0A9D4USA4_ADICA|nr:hypothetical protein GOP47_0011166 [Adiantum capillus-veneris]